METIFRHCVARSEKHVSNLTVIYLVFITNIPSYQNSHTQKYPNNDTICLCNSNNMGKASFNLPQQKSGIVQTFRPLNFCIQVSFPWVLKALKSTHHPPLMDQIFAEAKQMDPSIEIRSVYLIFSKHESYIYIYSGQLAVTWLNNFIF